LALFRWRLAILLTILAGLLVWAWVNDRSSPAYPGGQFGPLLLWAMLVVGSVAAPIGFGLTIGHAFVGWMKRTTRTDAMHPPHQQTENHHE
jgi:hypothetical protein